MCYCPFDFYGLECENFNRPVCEIQRVSHPLTQCSAQNSRYYVYDYGQNDMPCYHVDKNKPLELEFKLVCKNEDPRWNYEGVKVEEDLDYTVTSTTYPFTHYAINTPELKISQSATMALQIKFANWERIFKPFVLTDQITPNKAVGYENIKYTVDLKSIADHHSKSGRYTYEVILDSDLMSLGQVLGVLEDAGYAEPVKTKPIVSFRFMLYLFVICLVVLVGYVLYKFRNVSLPKRRRKESYEPLIEMHDVSEQSPAST